MSIKMNFAEWKDFIYRLNHPSQEEMKVLKQTFKKCEALTVIHEDNRTIIINPDINYEELDVCINNKKKDF